MRWIKEKISGIPKSIDRLRWKTTPGRAKCRKLKEIRRKIAEANRIYLPVRECDHEGPCDGTCEACDREVYYLRKELEKLSSNGIEINLRGIADADLKRARIPDSIICDETRGLMGLPMEPFGDDSSSGRKTEWEDDDDTDMMGIYDFNDLNNQE